MQYTHTFKVETRVDKDLLNYVNNLLLNRRANIINIRPSEYYYKLLTSSQKKIFDLVYRVECCECPVCYTNIDKSNEFTTHCNHTFCKDCIKKVFYTSAKCPLCRSEFTDDDADFLETEYYSVILIFSHKLYALDCIYYYNCILMIKSLIILLYKLYFIYKFCLW